MSRTKEGVRRSLSRTAMILALGLCLAELGCMSTSGLRSDEPARPSLFGFWDRHQQPPPDPANDYYARYMHAAKARTEATAGASGDPAGRRRTDRPARSRRDAGRRRAAHRPRAPRTSRRNATSDGGADQDEDIHDHAGDARAAPVAVASSGDPARLHAFGRGPGSGPRRGLVPERTGRRPGTSPDAPRSLAPSPAEAAPAPAPRRPDPPRRPKPAAQDPRAILARSEAKLKIARHLPGQDVAGRTRRRPLAARGGGGPEHPPPAQGGPPGMGLRAQPGPRGHLLDPRRRPVALRPHAQVRHPAPHHEDGRRQPHGHAEQPALDHRGRLRHDHQEPPQVGRPDRRHEHRPGPCRLPGHRETPRPGPPQPCLHAGSRPTARPGPCSSMPVLCFRAWSSPRTPRDSSTRSTSITR